MDLNHARLPIPPYPRILPEQRCDYITKRALCQPYFKTFPRVKPPSRFRLTSPKLYDIINSRTEETLITNNVSASITRGSEPIEKNISVIDEKGNEYEATYPKRAKGLVKKGRARFVDENTICLACPPDIMEDTKMSDNNIKLKAVQTADEATEAVESIEAIEAVEPIETENVSDEELKQAAAEFLKKTGKAPTNNGGAEKVLELYQKISASGLPYSEKEPLLKKLLSEWKKIVEDISETALNAQPELTVGYILSQIEKIRQENEHIYKALETLSEIVTGQGPADVAGEGKAKGIADTVKCREATNQKLIAFYEKLYDDIKPPRSTKEMALEIVSQAVNHNYGDADPEQIANLAEAISSMLDGIRHIDH